MKIREYNKNWKKNERKNNIDFRIKEYIRSRLGTILNKYTKDGKITSSQRYGVNYKAIIEHLKPFPTDISKYHIDHIYPLSKFNFVNEDGSQNLEEIKKAFAPENHQWLLAEDNMRKSNKIIPNEKLMIYKGVNNMEEENTEASEESKEEDKSEDKEDSEESSE